MVAALCERRNPAVIDRCCRCPKCRAARSNRRIIRRNRLNAGQKPRARCNNRHKGWSIPQADYGKPRAVCSQSRGIWTFCTPNGTNREPFAKSNTPNAASLARDGATGMRDGASLVLEMAGRMRETAAFMQEMPKNTPFAPSRASTWIKTAGFQGRCPKVAAPAAPRDTKGCSNGAKSLSPARETGRQPRWK